MGNETKERIRLRVKPGTLLPHILTIKVDGVTTTLTFTPKCETALPFERAEALLKSYPNLFELDKGEIDPKNYKMRVTFKRDMVAQKVSQLTDDECLVAFDFLKDLIAKRGQSTDTDPANNGGGAGDTPVLAEMTKAQLVDLATQMELDVPAGATKADLIALIEESGKV